MYSAEPSKYSVLAEKSFEVAGNNADVLLKVKKFPTFFPLVSKPLLRADWIRTESELIIDS